MKVCQIRASDQLESVVEGTRVTEAIGKMVTILLEYATTRRVCAASVPTLPGRR